MAVRSSDRCRYNLSDIDRSVGRNWGRFQYNRSDIGTLEERNSGTCQCLLPGRNMSEEYMNYIRSRWRHRHFRKSRYFRSNHCRHWYRRRRHRRRHLHLHRRHLHPHRRQREPLALP